MQLLNIFPKQLANIILAFLGKGVTGLKLGKQIVYNNKSVSICCIRISSSGLILILFSNGKLRIYRNGKFGVKLIYCYSLPITIPNPISMIFLDSMR